MEMDNYRKAGKIAATIREGLRKKDLRGLTIFEICETIEKNIKNNKAKCAFPVNISINEIAAHYTAEPNDQKIIANNDLIKIDLGVHVDGFIADTAITIYNDDNDENLVRTAEIALTNVMSIIKNDIESNKIGRIIEETVVKYGCKPIINLSGHSLDRYTIHAGKSIPNTWSSDSFSLSINNAYACEPFVTTKAGKGFVIEGNIKNIFSLVSRKKTKNKKADELLEYIWNNFNTLPFALRWINNWDVKEARLLLGVLIKNRSIHAYPVLLEANKQKVAQAEHTFIPIKNGVNITTL